VFTLSGVVALSNISKTARRCDVLEMPAFCKVSKASLCFESVTMPDSYQKCNRVATIIKLKKNVVIDSFHGINVISISKDNEAARRRLRRRIT
jgi:hypothetical protein